MSLIKKKVASVSSKTYPVQVASMDAELQFVIEVSKKKNIYIYIYIYIFDIFVFISIVVKTLAFISKIVT